nr:immunoglobulin heavy chain junction region [Mus musculus]
CARQYNYDVYTMDYW